MREALRLAGALVIVVPLTLAWCHLVRWLALKLFHRWF